MKAAAPPVKGINALLDRVCHTYYLRTDAHLARFLDVAPSVISKLRRGGYRMTDRVILRIYENTDLSLQEIRAYLQQPAASGEAHLSPEAPAGAPAL